MPCSDFVCSTKRGFDRGFPVHKGKALAAALEKERFTVQRCSVYNFFTGFVAGAFFIGWLLLA
jgi:hypothetical protein